MDSDTDFGRRQFLAAVAGSAAALSAPAAPTSAQTTAEEYAGKLVFCYDDSPREDYTKTFPIHQDEGVPGCVAAVSGNLGTDGSLTVDQLDEIESAGWEVLSHTIKHRAVGTLPLTEDAEEGDTKIYDVSNRHGAHPGDEVRIFDDDTHVIATVEGQGEDATGDYVVLEEPIEESFTALESFVRYTDEQLRRSIGESKAQLEDDGFDVSNFVLPYGINGPRARELIPEYYDCVHNANWRGNGLNPLDGFNPYNAHRTYFRDGEMTVSDLEEWLDGLVRHDVLGFLGGHSQFEDLTAERIRTAIRLAKERDIEIVTLRDALADIETVDDDPLETAVSMTTPGTPRKATLGTWTPSGGRDTTDEPAETGGQHGFGFGAAVAGAGLYAWRHLRD